MKIILPVFIVICFVLSPIGCFSDDSTVVVVATGSSTLEGNQSLSDARNSALNDARRNAIEQACGIEVSSESVVKDFMLSYDIVQSKTSGVIISEKIIKSNVENVSKIKENPVLMVTVEIEASVKIINDKGDEFFKLEAKSNRLSYREGDEFQLRITPSKDCFLYIFLFTEEQQAYVLFPNRHKKENFLQADKEFIFPSQDDKDRGINLKVALPKNKNKTSETIKIVAVKEKADFLTRRTTEAVGKASYDTGSLGVNELIMEIVSLPRAERAEKTINYLISRE